MELSQYLAIARRRWWLLFASILIGGGAAYAASDRIPPTYEATATLLIVQTQTEGVVQLNDLQTSERLANTFRRLVTIQPVLERAIAEGGLALTTEELKERLSVSNPSST